MPHAGHPSSKPKINLLRASEAPSRAVPLSASAAPKTYSARDFNCDWARLDHDNDGRADGCNGGDDGSICWGACCSQPVRCRLPPRPLPFALLATPPKAPTFPQRPLAH